MILSVVPAKPYGSNTPIYLGDIAPISDSEIVSEINARGYYLSSSPSSSPAPTSSTAMSRSDAIKYGVNKALTEQGYYTQVYTYTYIPSGTWSIIVSNAKSYAMNYLTGTWARPLSGVNLGSLGTDYDPCAYLQDTADYYNCVMQNQTPQEQADYSAWILVLQILGSSLQSVSGYLQGQQLRSTIGTQAGYYGVSIPNQLTPMQFEAMVQQYKTMYPNMSESEIRQRLAWVFNQEYQGNKGSWFDNIPTWLLPFGVGLGFVYLFMKMNKKEK